MRCMHRDSGMLMARLGLASPRLGDAEEEDVNEQGTQNDPAHARPPDKPAEQPESDVTAPSWHLNEWLLEDTKPHA